VTVCHSGPGRAMPLTIPIVAMLTSRRRSLRRSSL
jgi:hypothetical protein